MKPGSSFQTTNMILSTTIIPILYLGAFSSFPQVSGEMPSLHTTSMIWYLGFFFFFFFSKPSHMEEFLQNLFSPHFTWSGLCLWSVALASCTQPLTLPPPSLPYNVFSLAFPQVTQLERAALLEPGLLTLFQKKEVEPLPPDFSQARPGPPPTCLCSYTCFYLNLPLDHSLPFLSCCLHKALSSPPCSVDPFHVNYHI